MAHAIESGKEKENLDFLTSVLLEGQEFEFEFSKRKGDFLIEGKIKIKEQDICFSPKGAPVLNPKTRVWMRTHPKYWRILCGLEQADTKTNVNIFGMLVRADLTELAEMMHHRIDGIVERL
jgi:hypothetical protein